MEPKKFYKNWVIICITWAIITLLTFTLLKSGQNSEIITYTAVCSFGFLVPLLIFLGELTHNISLSLSKLSMWLIQFIIIMIAGYAISKMEQVKRERTVIFWIIAGIATICFNLYIAHIYIIPRIFGST